MKNFFYNLKIVFHDLGSYIRDDRHISRKAKISLLIVISVITFLYIANYIYLKIQSDSYSNITELVNKGEYRTADKKLFNILKNHSNDPYFLILAARTSIGLSEEVFNARMKGLYLNKSLSFLSKAEMINPNLVEIYRIRGLANFYLGEFTRAELAYKKALTLDNNSSQIWSDLGDVYLIEGDITLASEAFKKALVLDSKNEQANIGIIKLFVLQNKIDRVLNSGQVLYASTLDRSIKLQIIEILGHANSKLTNYDEAIRFFNEGLKIDPKSISMNYGLAETIFYSSFDIKNPEDSTKEAKSMALNIITMNPSYPFSYALLTRIGAAVNNKVEYDKYMEITKNKINEYSFMNKKQKEFFLKTIPLFNQPNENVTIKVKSVKSILGNSGENNNILQTK